MSHEAEQPLPLWRLAAYVLIFGACGFIAAREFYYAVAGNTTTGTVLAVGRSKGSSRAATFWADYEYIDDLGQRHTGRATVHPTTTPFDPIEIQYLRHAPDSSRLAATPMYGLSFFVVAVLALTVFIAELIVRRVKHRARSMQ